MAASSSPSRPSWQRNPVFRFFASLKLAVVLLAVLIIGSIVGTLYESTFDAKVARAYVYGAPWFNLWLLLLAANLTGAAFSRWPWKKHHVAFLITHLGIITLLAGSLIGRTWGIEGTITLFKGEPPTNRLLVDEHQLRVRDTDGIVKGYPAEFIHRPPTPEKPWDLGLLAGGGRLSMIDYSPALEGKLNPKPLKEGGAPAVHFTVATAMMNQRLESWLLADEHQHAFNMGLATVELKRGAAPSSPEAKGDSPSPPPPDAPAEVEMEETMFAFAKAPEEQIAKVRKGGSTGAKVQLTQPQGGNKGTVVVQLAGKTWTFDVAKNLGNDIPMDGSPFTLRIENYWPDFRLENGKPGSLSDQPNNPAVVVTIRGKGVPASSAPNPHGDTPPGVAPEMPAAGTTPPNRLTLFIADDGSVTYDLRSKTGNTTGKLELNTPLTTGWADWQLTLDQVMPHAQEWMDFAPAKNPPATADMPDGVRIRLQQGSQTSEQWIPAGWQVSVPASPADVQIAYGWKMIQLPIALELLEFEVLRNEGNDSPAGFKSTVRVATPEGQTATGQCWMNNPFNFPGKWQNTWTGLTFKMSQASWNPENLGQSTIQILRDPGWLLKWIGSLLIVCGIFLLFYVKSFRRPSRSVVPPPSLKPAAEKPEEVLVSSAT